jgi:hypothetical protein
VRLCLLWVKARRADYWISNALRYPTAHRIWALHRSVTARLGSSPKYSRHNSPSPTFSLVRPVTGGTTTQTPMSGRLLSRHTQEEATLSVLRPTRTGTVMGGTTRGRGITVGQTGEGGIARRLSEETGMRKRRNRRLYLRLVRIGTTGTEDVMDMRSPIGTDDAFGACRTILGRATCTDGLPAKPKMGNRTIPMHAVVSSHSSFA